MAEILEDQRHDKHQNVWTESTIRDGIKESSLRTSGKHHVQEFSDGSSSESFQTRDATDEEIDSLPHVMDSTPTAAWIVVLAGAAERFTYFGIIAPWRRFDCYSNCIFVY